MQDQYTKEELSEQINLKWRGGNSLVNATLTEEQQEQIATHCKTNTLTATAAYFNIAKSRVKLICDKYDIEPMRRYKKEATLSKGHLQQIKGMIGKTLYRNPFLRTITGYTLHEDSVTIHTKLLGSGAERPVTLGFEGIGRELGYFIKWNTAR